MPCLSVFFASLGIEKLREKCVVVGGKKTHFIGVESGVKLKIRCPRRMDRERGRESQVSRRFS